jgi:ataxin-10
MQLIPPFFADLREHAILTLRNLLTGNEANQAVVQDLQPIGGWDGTSVLQTVSEPVQG